VLAATRRRIGCCPCLAVAVAPVVAAAAAAAAGVGRTDWSPRFVVAVAVAAEAVQRDSSLHFAAVAVAAAGQTSSIRSSAAVVVLIQTSYCCCCCCYSGGRSMTRRDRQTVSRLTAVAVAAAIDQTDHQLVL